MKKLSTKEIKGLKKEYLKLQIETEKKTFRRYIKLLVKYNFSQSASNGIYFKEMYDSIVLKGFDAIDSSSIPTKDKVKLKINHFGLWDKEKGNIEESNLKYYKQLVGWAKREIEDLKQDTKEKMVEDAISMVNLWHEQFNRNFKLFEKLKKFKKK